MFWSFGFHLISKKNPQKLLPSGRKKDIFLLLILPEYLKRLIQLIDWEEEIFPCFAFFRTQGLGSRIARGKSFECKVKLDEGIYLCS